MLFGGRLEIRFQPNLVKDRIVWKSLSDSCIIDGCRMDRGKVPARSPGGTRYNALEDAPGSYVRMRT